MLSPFMTKVNTNALFTFFLALLLVGCSTSQPIATTAEQPTATQDTTTSTRTSSPSTESQSSAPTDTSAEQNARTEAPEDWFHLDREAQEIPGLATKKAYQTFLQDRAPQDTVTVAILDSGIDVDHEDLTAETWTNRDEIANNGIDDDKNGYVDDVQGWNFIGGQMGKT